MLYDGTVGLVVLGHISVISFIDRYDISVEIMK